MADDTFANAVATGATIDDYLVSLASGVAEAQRRLNQLGAAAEGPASPVAYQIPKLEFELRMTFAVQTGDRPDDGAPVTSAAALTRSAARQLRFQTITSSTQSSVASTLRGSIVAVPTSGGRPAPRLDVSAEPLELAAEALPEGAKAVVLVTAEVSNAAGELLEGEEVQFNIDRDLSARVNQENGIAATDLDVGTFLARAVVPTDRRGLAATQLVVHENEVPGAAVAITVDAVQRTRALIFRVPDAG